MQGYDKQLEHISTKGGALQAAYLQKAAKRQNGGFLQRMMGHTIPSFRKGKPTGEETTISGQSLRQQTVDSSTHPPLEHTDAKAQGSIEHNDMRRYERWEQQQKYRDAVGEKSPADLQVKYLEGALKFRNLPPPNSNNLQSSSSPIKEFGAQQACADDNFECQSGLLQAQILEQTLHNQQPPEQKSSWLKKMSPNPLHSSSSPVSQKEKVERSLAESRIIAQGEDYVNKG
jgi:hypothetical protein